MGIGQGRKWDDVWGKSTLQNWMWDKLRSEWHPFVGLGQFWLLRPSAAWSLMVGNLNIMILSIYSIFPKCQKHFAYIISAIFTTMLLCRLALLFRFAYKHLLKRKIDPNYSLKHLIGFVSHSVTAGFYKRFFFFLASGQWCRRKTLSGFAAVSNFHQNRAAHFVEPNCFRVILILILNNKLFQSWAVHG